MKKKILILSLFVVVISSLIFLAPGVQGQGTETLLPSVGEGFPQYLQAEVAILPSELDGVVGEVKALPQDFVKKNDTIVQLDPVLAQLAVDNAAVGLRNNEAEQEEATVRQQYAADNHEIQKKLYEVQVSGVPVAALKELKEAKQMLDLSGLALRKAQIQKDALLLEQRKSQEVLAKHAIKAPFDGVVVPFASVADKYMQQREPKRVMVGEAVRAGQPIAAIMKVDRLRISLLLPVDRMEEVNLGQGARVFVRGYEGEIPGTVVFKSPTVTSTGEFNVEVEIVNPPRANVEKQPAGSYRYQFRDGMRARVELK